MKAFNYLWIGELGIEHTGVRLTPYFNLLLSVQNNENRRMLIMYTETSVPSETHVIPPSKRSLARPFRGRTDDEQHHR